MLCCVASGGGDTVNHALFYEHNLLPLLLHDARPQLLHANVRIPCMPISVVNKLKGHITSESPSFALVTVI